eukprot:29051-Pelagococcus_subviridis.AAC.2
MRSPSMHDANSSKRPGPPVPPAPPSPSRASSSSLPSFATESTHASIRHSSPINRAMTSRV